MIWTSGCVSLILSLRAALLRGLRFAWVEHVCRMWGQQIERAVRKVGYEIFNASS